MSNPNQYSGPSQGSQSLPTPNLPVSQLESLKFKANQIIDSITALQWTIEAGGHPTAMFSWPDILSKYNMLLSQTHNFSTALVHPFPTSGFGSSATAKVPPQNIYERIALHPSTGVTDAQLDGEIAPILRNQQTTDVLNKENDTVRRLAEHMKTRGSLGVLGISTPPPPLGVFGVPKKPEYEDVLKECEEIRGEHDRRVERAVRAVTMLKEKYDWKARVEVQEEEPEELAWDPRLSKLAQEGGLEVDEEVGMDASSEEEDEEPNGEKEGNAEADKGGNSDEDDEFNVEGVLFNADTTSPPMEGDLFDGVASAMDDSV
ncbi:hypothetical protein CPB84DRAFT_986588 [Gymnopilus junonius]|uniref:Mediator complex subunit 8 n=1 Tax=Gymnopilus junonius TaxID=109634 RepID=A0A9P5NNU3_GYMJU|nr:hypothetical protein CPB84DRAFT_986588 [Gymnopilus junonius]